MHGIVIETAVVIDLKRNLHTKNKNYISANLESFIILISEASRPVNLTATTYE